MARSDVDHDVMLAPDRRVLARRFSVMAALLFGFQLVMLGLAAIGTQVPDAQPTSERVLALAGIAIAGAVLGIAVVGLLSGRVWAASLARILLWLFILVGAIGALVATGDGTFSVPIGAIAAIVVLRLRPRGVGGLPPATRDRAVVGLLTALYLLALASPALSAGLLAPGASPLSVGPDAIELTVEPDCGEGRQPVRPITITARWHWREQERLPGGRDGLVIAWYAVMEQRTLVVGSVEPSDGVAREVEWPASVLIDPEAARDQRAETFTIDVQHTGLQDGAVRLTLLPGDDPGAFHFAVRGAYAHLDRWLVRTSYLECAFGTP